MGSRRDHISMQTCAYAVRFRPYGAFPYVQAGYGLYTGIIQAYSAACSRRDPATVLSQFRPQVFVSAAREFFHDEFESTIGSQNGSRVRLTIFAAGSGCSSQGARFSRRDGKRKRSFGHAFKLALRYAKNAAYSFGFGRSRRDNFGRPKKPPSWRAFGQAPGPPRPRGV